MMLTVAILVVMSQAETVIEEYKPGLYQRTLDACKASKGSTSSQAYAECVENSPELLEAEKFCTGKHGENHAAVMQCLGIVDASNMPLDQLESTISERHPLDYYILSSRLLQAGNQDRAAFWFYAGQLRWRIRLSCHNDLPPDGEPALSASMNHSLGPMINEYLGGYPTKWKTTIQDVLEWDAVTANGYEGKGDCASQIEKQRKGLNGLADYIEQNRAKIAENRKKNGLPNYE